MQQRVSSPSPAKTSEELPRTPRGQLEKTGIVPDGLTALFNGYRHIKGRMREKFAKAENLQKVVIKLCAPQTKFDEAQMTPSLGKRCEPNVLKTRPTKLRAQKDSNTTKRPRDGMPE